MTVIAITIVAALLAGAFYGVWKAHEEAKAERARDQRRMLEAAHRTPRPFSEKAAQGFHRRGNDAA